MLPGSTSAAAAREARADQSRDGRLIDLLKGNEEDRLSPEPGTARRNRPHMAPVPFATSFVYLAGFCTVDLAAHGYTACTSRIDPSGDSVWEWRADDNKYLPMALAVAGDSLVTVGGRFESMEDDGEPRILRFDRESGAPGPVIDLVSFPEPNLFAGLRGGDVVLTSVVDSKGVVHRIGPDGEARWAVPAEFNRFTGILDLATGPDDSIILVGDTRDEPRATPVMRDIARALDGDGALAWDLDLPPESPWGSCRSTRPPTAPASS